MTTSSGDKRRSAPRKSATTPVSSDLPEASDVPKAGARPVRRTVRPVDDRNTAPAKATTATRTSAATATPLNRTAGKTPDATATDPAEVQAPTPARKAVPAFRAPSPGTVRRPVRATRQNRNVGRIVLYVATGVVAVAIVLLGAWPSISKNFQQSWQERAAKISGIHNYLQTNPEWFAYDPQTGNQQSGTLTYQTSPPVGGTVNPQWQDCHGEVYAAQIPNEQAAHSLENGAVWITYRPDLPPDQIDKLASKVTGKDFMMMSPYPDLDSAISLQAWGYQLKVDNAGDKRIDEFISALRVNAAQDTQSGCSGGITDTGTTPLDLPGLGM